MAEVAAQGQEEGVVPGGCEGLDVAAFDGGVAEGGVGTLDHAGVNVGDVVGLIGVGGDGPEGLVVGGVDQGDVSSQVVEHGGVCRGVGEAHAFDERRTDGG